MSKFSRYNHLQPWRDDSFIAFNARSGAIAVMDADNFRTYCSILAKLSTANGDSQLTEDESALLKQLEFGKFAYAGSQDEVESLKFQHGLSRFDMTTLGMVIAPTMACNMACQYCFEPNKVGKMSKDVQDAIYSYVEKQADSLKNFDICWYGGEPLLGLDVIESLTTRFVDLSRQKNFRYTSTMISNGYLMTPQVVDKLVSLKVSMVQVTLDGPARIHNVKRPLKNGKVSFEQILSNVAYAVDKLMITIRINVDRDFDSETIEELLLELKAAGLERKVGVYFGQLEPATSVCSNIADNCYSNPDFSAVEIDYFQLLLKHHFRIEKLPQPTSAFCMAQRANAFLIDPEGELYRCFNYVGDPDRSMGNIHYPIQYGHANFTRLFDFNPFENKKCRECNILPICFGGCPAQRSDRDLSASELCQGWKHNLIPMLEIIACSRQQKYEKTVKEPI